MIKLVSALLTHNSSIKGTALHQFFTIKNHAWGLSPVSEQLEERVAYLEAEVARLKHKLESNSSLLQKPSRAIIKDWRFSPC